jgi:uncharacterized integral membrane protein
LIIDQIPEHRLYSSWEDTVQVLKFAALVAFLLLCVFVAVNWSVLTAPTTLSLVLGQVSAPVGLIMLMLSIALTILFLVYAVSLRTTMLLETRRHSRELKAQRELADQAEASRFTELRSYLEGVLGEINVSIDAAAGKTVARCDALEESVGHALTDTANTLSAHIGEVDEKLDRLVLGLADNSK